jgi:glycosyltransferase involved in cell wall biosynthesis
MDGRRLTVLQMLPALDSGGVERGTLQVARELVRRGHRSLVISTGGRLVPQLEADGSEHVTWRVSKSDHVIPLSYVWKLRDLLRRERVDILHVRSRHPAWLAWLAWRGMAQSTRPKFVTTAHGLYSVNWYSGVMARGERVIAISQTVRDYLLANYPRLARPETTAVIYRGVQEEGYDFDFAPSEEWLRRWEAEYPHLAGRPLVTLPGRLTRLKGHGDFLRLLELLARDRPDVQGVIVGGADPRRAGYAEELRRTVRDMGLRNVTFTGHRNDLREILAISRVALSLTANPPEAFGRTVAEALSLGTPVVGYDHAGTGEVLRALFPAGAVPPGDVAAAAGRTREMLDIAQPEIRPNTVFRERRMLDQTLALYRDAA